MLFFHVFCSTEFFSSFLSLPVPVKEVFPWISTLKNEAGMHVVTLMCRIAANLKCSSRIASVGVAAMAIEKFQTQVMQHVIVRL